ncbi:MAG: hypothetical protein EAZ47_09075 [Bacteroidetes bacterium]|nr:MAG: hypothetical protein EAY72_03110 [Bacteroidota bacterium]TAF92232.1 MAG: hypothetical protein EAZ47_09075 [Bacteroidota bacterium]
MKIFELFDIEPRFVVDAALLKNKWLQLSKQYHPDYLQQATEWEQADALQTLAEINKAYKLLQNKTQLIEYILSEKGIIQAGEKQSIEPQFLASVMDANEQLADAEFEGDTAAQQEIFSELEQTNHELETSMAAIFKKTVASCTQEELLQIKQYLFHKKYLARILERKI